MASRPFKVGDRVVADFNSVNPAFHGVFLGYEGGDGRVRFDRGYGSDSEGIMWAIDDLVLESPPEPKPDIGTVIEFKDIRPGDVVRQVWTDMDIEYTATIPVFDIGYDNVSSPRGQALGWQRGGEWYLVSRPEVDSEVQALMDVLGVDADTASDYHSKGVRATEPAVEGDDDIYA